MNTSGLREGVDRCCPKCQHSMDDVEPVIVDYRKNVEATAQYGYICIEWTERWTCPVCGWDEWNENANY